MSNTPSPFRRPGRCAAASRDDDAHTPPLPQEAPDQVRGDEKEAATGRTMTEHDIS